VELRRQLPVELPPDRRRCINQQYVHPGISGNQRRGDPRWPCAYHHNPG
jgi:hypothetical protein